MNEDAKKKLNEKLGAAVTDEQLEKVAGGSKEENMEILTAMRKIDPQGVDDLFDRIHKKAPEGMEDKWIAGGTTALLAKNFGIYSATDNYANNSYDNSSYHAMSHAQVLDMINKKAAEMGHCMVRGIIIGIISVIVSR